MTAFRKFLVLIGFISFIAATMAFGSASNIYITQNGSPSGNCATNVQTPAFFNSASNWGSGANQIGPGTTVLLCGTFNVTPGASGFSVLGSGSSGSPLTVLLDAGAVIQSTYLGGTDPFSSGCGPASACRAGIAVFKQNYVTIDGGANGVIQNTANGTNLANHQTSTGVYLSGDHLIVRDLTIQNIYQNAGSSPSATDGAGSGTTDIRVDSASTNIAIYNNTLNSARTGISSGTNGSTGPANCPAPTGATGVTTSSLPAPSGNWGICYFNNSVSDHDWSILTAGQGTVNIYGNEIGDIGTLPGWLNWQFPTSAYHQDGIFIWGTSGNEVVTANVYNNYIHGDLGQGSPSGLIYCASAEDGVSGCALTAFNNVIVQTASAQWPNDAANDQLVAVDLSASVGSMGPIVLYNNTFVAGAYAIEIYTAAGGKNAAFTLRNNIFNGSGTYLNQTDAGAPIASMMASNNLYYQSTSNTYNAWSYQGANIGSLAAWQTACHCDTSPSTVANPNLQSDLTPASGSPAIGRGSNLSSLSLAPLGMDKNAVTRGVPSCSPAVGIAGCWDVGAYQASNGAIQPPANLAASVQ
ncbi:MAG: hypothetical protein ACRD2U_11635 [Terriglobales bacterium]